MRIYTPFFTISAFPRFITIEHSQLPGRGTQCWPISRSPRQGMIKWVALYHPTPASSWVIFLHATGGFGTSREIGERSLSSQSSVSSNSIRVNRNQYKYHCPVIGDLTKAHWHKKVLVSTHHSSTYAHCHIRIESCSLRLGDGQSWITVSVTTVATTENAT